MRLAAGADNGALAADARRADEADVFETTDWGWNSRTIIAERNGRYVTTDDRIVSASSTQIWEWFTKEVFLVRPEDGNEGLASIATWKDEPVSLGPDGGLVVGSGNAAQTANAINVSGAAGLGGDAARLQTAERFARE